MTVYDNIAERSDSSAVGHSSSTVEVQKSMNIKISYRLLNVY